MILYLDASALVKRYINEAGSTEINQIILQAQAVGTVAISQAEVSAALSKTVRMKVLTKQDALTSLELFRSDRSDLARIQVTEAVINQADALVWTHNLRGYDAVHLAAALVWQKSLGLNVTLAAFDRQLWTSAKQAGLLTYPTDLTAMLADWERQAASPLNSAKRK